MTDTQDLYCLLVPLEDQRLLVPSAAVVEIIRGGLNLSEGDNAVGYIQWQARKIKVYSFEALAGRQQPTLLRRSRIVLVRKLNKAHGYYGLISQGHPHLLKVNQPLLGNQAKPAEHSLLAMHVEIAGIATDLPDLDALEAML